MLLCVGVYLEKNNFIKCNLLFNNIMNYKFI